MGQKTVLVTGANGYIGFATSLAFARANYKVLGLLRTTADAVTLDALKKGGVTPLPVASYSDTAAVLSAVQSQTSAVDILVSTTEQWPDWNAHAADIMAVVEAVAKMSRDTWSTESGQAGKKMLLIFTSGCKDYGTTGLHGSPGLAPHTEESPLKAPSFLQIRAEGAAKVLREGTQGGLYDVLVTRPTNVYGGSSSAFAMWFMAAEKAAAEGKLEFPSPRETILHSMHVDDCAEAYVALVEHQPREDVAGQFFNMSGREYDTLDKVAQALAKEYQIPGEITYGDEFHSVFGYSQWVGSEKIRRLTGWTDHRKLFADGIAEYRRDYEAAKGDEHDRRMMGKLERLNKGISKGINADSS